MTHSSENGLAVYVDKLERRVVFSTAERTALLTLPVELVRVTSRTIVASEGDVARRCCFVASGFLSRQRRVGSRQEIMAICLPGDAADLQTLWIGVHDHSLVAHGHAVLAFVAHEPLGELCERNSLIMKSLWHDTLVEASIFRDWALNVGHRRAHARIGHLFLEIDARLRARGLVHDDVFEVPFRQAELASMVGLSLVHFNKTLRGLREEGLIELEGFSLRILNRARLSDIAQFDPTYLHLDNGPAHP